MKIGQKLNYFGKNVKVVKFDNTHVLVKFESGSLLCTPKSTFS